MEKEQNKTWEKRFHSHVHMMRENWFPIRLHRRPPQDQKQKTTMDLISSYSSASFAAYIHSPAIEISFSNLCWQICLRNLSSAFRECSFFRCLFAGSTRQKKKRNRSRRQLMANFFFWFTFSCAMLNSSTLFNGKKNPVEWKSDWRT